MIQIPQFNTAGTDALCREIAKKSNRVCFLMCSRGKDSLCAWLQLRRYFDRIIPFHCATVPGYRFADEYLDYLEVMFQTKVLRLMGEDLRMALVRHIYQETPWECDEIDAVFEDRDYNKLDILDYLRMKFNLPRAWCAVGISQNDSIDRLIYCRKTGGKNMKNRTFYPCYDWPREELLKAIMGAELMVSPEYKYTKRSMGGVPSATYNKVMMEHFPEDWETTKKWYPLAEVKNYREDMIDSNYPLWLEQEATKVCAEHKENETRKEESKMEHIEVPQSEEGTEEEVLPLCALEELGDGTYVISEEEMGEEE